MRKILFVLVLALGLIAPVAKADFTFGTPTNLGPTVNSSAGDNTPSISADGLTLYFDSRRPGGYGKHDIWVSTRPTTDDPWGEPMNLGPTVNSSDYDNIPFISADGLKLFFVSERPGGYGSWDIWVTTRPTTDADWSAPVNLGPTVNSSADEFCPAISADGLQLYFSEWEVFRPGGYGGSDMWVTTRDTASDPWGTPVNLGPTVNSSAHDDNPFVTADGLALFFSSNRPGAYGIEDIFVARRATSDDPWGEPVNLGPTVNSSDGDYGPRISADGSTLYFTSNRAGGVGNFDIWQVSILPVVDFNGDGIVDVEDVVILTDHWGEKNYPLCDIGPTPLGDGIVDVQDLIVLAKYIDPALIAHWKLDETEGTIAHDTAGDHDGFVIGPVWHPDGGMVAGALQFDGIDDYVSTEFVLDPADGEFSVFAWVKGGGPGEVIISQTGGTTGYSSTWLGIDASEGKLITKLMFFWLPLESESVITDDAWHRVGVVWDGAHRYLYLDGTEVAKDTSPFSTGFRSDGGLYFGTGNNLDAGSFWSGLIDDVRIYNRAVTP